MRLVFCGTPPFAVPALKKLLGQPGFELLGVITQPDRPRGRGQGVSFSAVKETALSAGLPVHQPEKIRAPEVQELLQRLAPEAVVIIAYGQIIPAGLLSLPKFGWINLHASLLPKYRGAAPIHWAIVNGEEKTGITTMRIDAGMDTGEILLQRELDIGPEETAPELSARLAEAGAPLMVETLRGLAAGSLMPRAQDSSAASYAPLLKREDGRIDWSLSARNIFNRIRGFDPWPGAFTTFRGQSCHVWGGPVSNGREEESAKSLGQIPPGTLLPEREGMNVVCGDATLLRVSSVKVEGRKRIAAAEFLHGAHVKRGERFGQR
jgi:methionyl-tRNA formyltransferase